jgi:hypothetical protein
MKNLLAFVLIFVTVSAYAAIYQQVDESGNTTYSDMPLNQNAKVVELKSTTIPSTTDLNASVSTTASTDAKSKDTKAPAVTAQEEVLQPYSYFAIDVPKDNDTFQNQRSIPVEVKTTPALQKGDKVQLYLDGNPFGAPQESSHLTLDNVERGSHQISASLVRGGQVLRTSQVITLFIHYANAGLPKSGG